MAAEARSARNAAGASDSMPHQPNLFSDEPEGSARAIVALPAESGGAGRLREPQPRWSQWLARVELLVRVMVRLYLGLLIVALPWMRFWTENGLLGYSHATALVAGSGFVRGLVSGLGILNVSIALKELFSGSVRPR